MTAVELSPAMRALGNELVTDLERNIAMVTEADSADPVHAALVRWASYLGGLAAETFAGVVALLEAGRPRAAYALARALIEQHLRLRYYVVQAREVKHAAESSEALRDWDGGAGAGAPLPSLFEPDEWSDEEQQRIAERFEAGPAPAEQLRAWCAYLEEREKKENDYRWARAAWLVEGALARGDRAFAEPVAIDPRVIFFDAVWYLLDLMDSLGMIYGWTYGAVKHRQDAIKLYLIVKPDAGK